MRDDGKQYQTIPIVKNDKQNLRSKEQQKGKEIRVEAVLNKNDPRH